ncbi:hypothetical protein [uncultured Planktomarina sp.]|uniref:hypothetical protein n=1 Tax=uncultured Planktomarina sp. TaxID=1538529 RepID=UPI0032604A70
MTKTDTKIASAGVVPYSSVVGSSVMLLNAAGACVGQLGIVGVGDQAAQEAVAQRVADAINAEAVTTNSKAVADVLVERVRQVTVEGWSHEHDDEHDAGEIAAAAASYSFNAYLGQSVRSYAAEAVGFWPWDLDWWKPTTPRRDLVKAAALILAEIERLDRVADQATQGEAGE